MKVITNPDKETVKELRRKIKENNGHCACAVLFNEENKCICEEFREQIDRGEPGYCHCGLYCVVVD